MYRTLDPATEELIEEFPLAEAAAIDAAVARSLAAFARQRSRSFAERAAILVRLADALEIGVESLAETMALEMGKPLLQGVAEAQKCAWVCRHYAEHGAEMLAAEPRESDGASAEVRFAPLGVVLAIMPWNFPFWQLFRFAAPAWMAGNSVILKHAPNTPRCALEIERLVREASGDDGLLVNLFLSNEQAAELVARREVAAVTLTGSSRAGRAVGAVAGAQLKPAVLELGGSDAFVVLGDADVDRAAEVGVRARCLNSGQSCIAAKRFVVHAAVYDAFRDVFVAGMRAQRVGDPRSEDTAIGPLARRDLRDLLTEQVDDALAHGARALLGGERPSGRGFFSPPTVLEGVGARARAYREELFGPVACLYRAGSDDEALALANATDFGLGASVWTRDPARAERFVGALETGSVFVNGLVKSDPRLPFGGVKDSGYGRELGVEGVRAFVNVKTVWVG
ncbi:MAG TPA: NAD-dependent succinate-semialdehyde dehydrogenase [Thermoanaerobaculia bacterium]